MRKASSRRGDGRKRFAGPSFQTIWEMFAIDIDEALCGQPSPGGRRLAGFSWGKACR